MIPIKNEKDLEMLKAAGKILAKIMQRLQECICVGISTGEIDELSEDLVRRENVISAFKGYRGFPANICTSINEEIVHGIPGERRLKSGDIISLDLGINYEGYFSDAAITVAVGRVNSKIKKLIKVTKSALSEGIKQARANNYLSNISYAIGSYVERHRFSVVRQFVGHGIGCSLHEEPEIPNFGRAGQGPILMPGMVLAIEPMVNMGKWESEILDNGWTAVTKDGMPSAHFEHTIAITEDGPQILTA
ncbi:MAG: type I methionyl aminopeptidase [Candidatus Omnitrophica bacterium]|nr:type I methionyl aminopeptidase [Candidatus Omnitrophota bacterium]MBU4345852.1 type I methionyl aminopeptidase [Candidatus Omnitrophota bacterium]MBU4473323.1 type I methionyl aminopeptidase [Candidatus Omnitrophota bacterium]MCG2706618.1 type I methionyl aminopeptidase [Candidatus Omnitrophota bacterium]